MPVENRLSRTTHKPMKYLLPSLFLLITSIALSGFLANDDKPRARLNVWMADGMPVTSDSSSWTNSNQFQIDFFSLNSLREPGKKRIGLVFAKWPVVSGKYKLVAFPRKDDEMAVLANDGSNIYRTRPGGSGNGHVRMDNGKLSAWANNIPLEIIADGTHRTLRTPLDSAVFSFNLRAF